MLWILLPAFNEEASIPNLFPKIDAAMKDRNQEYRLVVVNDGSTDRTGEVLKQYESSYPLTVLTHSINRGLGETERDGFEYLASVSADDDYLCRFDCDDTHEPAYIFSMIDKIKEGYDVVNTSRFQPGGGQKGVDSYRTAVSLAANVFMSFVFWIPGVRDHSCGFRVYRAKVIKDAVSIFGNSFIQLKGLGFTCTLEMIVKLKLLGCRFAEVPFVLRYDQRLSKSKMVSSVTTLGYMVMALCYHWPFGGWRTTFRDLGTTYKQSRENALSMFGRQSRRRTLISAIGG